MDSFHEDLGVLFCPRTVLYRCIEYAAIIGNSLPLYNTKRVWEGGFGSCLGQWKSVESWMVSLKMFTFGEGGAILISDGFDTA